jgi:hypothetical protein
MVSSGWLLIAGATRRLVPRCCSRLRSGKFALAGPQSLWCELKCPEDALGSVFSRAFLRMLVGPFLQYNMRHWSQEEA